MNTLDKTTSVTNVLIEEDCQERGLRILAKIIARHLNEKRQKTGDEKVNQQKSPSANTRAKNT